MTCICPTANSMQHNVPMTCGPSAIAEPLVSVLFCETHSAMDANLVCVLLTALAAHMNNHVII